MLTFQNALFLLIFLQGQGMSSDPHADHGPLPETSPVFFEFLCRTNPHFPQDRVNSVLKGRWGFLWIATDRGLLRYDGQDIHRYRRELDVEGSLASDKVRLIFEDRSGQLWIGTQNGLHRLDRATGKAHLWLDAHGNTASLPSKNIWSIQDDDRGRLWVGTDHGLAVGRLDSLVFEPVDALDGIGITAIVQDETGNMLIGTESEGLRTGNDPEGLWPIIPDGGELSVRCLLRQGSDLFVGTWHRGLMIRRSEKWLQMEPKDSTEEDDKSVRSLTATEDGTVWVGMAQGLFKISPQSDGWHRVSPDKFRNLNSPGITALHGDWDDMLWVATHQGGLHFEDLRYKNFKFQSSLQKDFFTLFRDQKDRFWYGTPQGLLQMDGAEIKSHYLKDIFISQICPLNEKQWFVLTTEGIYLLDLDRGEEILLDSLPHPWRIQPLGEGLYAVGTVAGLYLWHPFYGGLRHVSSDDGAPSLSHAYITSLEKDDQGQLWVGTYGGGVNRLSADWETVKTFAYTKGDPGGLSSNIVTDLILGPDQTLWIATHDGGLNRLDLRTEKITRWTVKDGLPDNAIVGVNYDGQGNIWLSNGEGLVRLDPQTSQFHVFTQSDGFLIGGALPGSRWADEERRWLVFGGTYGAIAFDTTNLEIPSPPPLVFTNIHLDQQLVHHLMLDNQLFEIDRPRKSITMGLALLDFRDQVAQPFRFRREHIDDSWTPFQAARIVSYTGFLPFGGEGLLEVEAKDHYLNPVYRNLQIQIKRPIWVVWAPLWVLMLLGLLIFAIKWVVERRMRKRQRALVEKARLAQEKQLLAEERAEIAEIQSKIANRERRFQQEVTQVLQQHLEQVSTEISNEVHDGPLGAVHGLAFRLRTIGNRIGEAAIKQELSELSGKVIPELAEQLRSVCGELLKPDFEAGLEAELSNYLAVIQDQSPQLSIDLQFEADTESCEVSILAAMYRIFRTLMKNIVKHAQAHQVLIQIQDVSGRLDLSIRDDGKGFRIPKSWTVFKDQGHFGLYMAHYFAHAAGGNFEVESELGRGTIIQVSLPKHQGEVGGADSNRHC